MEGKRVKKSAHVRPSGCLHLFPEAVWRDIDGRGAVLLWKPVEPERGMP